MKEREFAIAFTRENFSVDPISGALCCPSISYLQIRPSRATPYSQILMSLEQSGYAKENVIA